MSWHYAFVATESAIPGQRVRGKGDRSGIGRDQALNQDGYTGAVLLSTRSLIGGHLLAERGCPRSRAVGKGLLARKRAKAAVVRTKPAGTGKPARPRSRRLAP